jgi:hypothetical protein
MPLRGLDRRLDAVELAGRSLAAEASYARSPCDRLPWLEMTTDGTKLVVIDGRVTNEKLAELLDLQTEHPALDFKAIIDLTGKPGLIELAKDVGAFQVSGGYIIGGVDDHGVPNGAMDDCSPALFDEANLVPQLLRYLPEPLTIHSRVAEWKGHAVVIIFVGRIPTATRYSKPSASTGNRTTMMT